LDYATKRATILATLRKAHEMGSNPSQIFFSGVCKAREFLALGYPQGILQYLCRKVAYITKSYEWLDVAEAL